VADGRVRISLIRYSPALVLFAIVIADFRQLSDPDLWGHILFGRDLLAHGSLPFNNIYSYSAPACPWLHHEWLSEVLMSWIFDNYGAFGLKLLKFICTAGTISFVVLAMAETGATAALQSVILLLVALIVVPEMQFRPQIFDFLFLSAIIAMLSRHNWRGSAPLWIAIPMIAIWINLHGGFFIGLVAMGVYGAATIASDFLKGIVGRAAVHAGTRRGFEILAITAAAAATTLLTFLIPPARDSWYTLIYSLRNPATSSTIVDWRPLITSIIVAPAGSLERKYFIMVLLFFAAAAISVILKPRGADAPMVAVAAVLIATAVAAQRNIAIAMIAVAPVLANHLGLLLPQREGSTNSRPTPAATRWIIELLIAVAAIGFACHSGILKPGIDASGTPADAISFMNRHGLKGNVLADYPWGQFVLWHGAPGTKVFIDSRFDLGYPPAVVRDYMAFDRGYAGAALGAYPNDFVLTRRGWPAAKAMDSRRDWRLIYSDDVARLYAPANSVAAQIDGAPSTGAARQLFFP
jgi:hypothetical protein